MNKHNESVVVITNWGYQGTRSPISAPQAATDLTSVTTVVSGSARPQRPAAIDVDDFAAMFEQTPKDKKAMASARRWVGRGLDEQEQGTIKALRCAAGLSQSQLANQVGLQQPNISAIESGNRKPEYETAQKLARSLGVTVEEIYIAFEKINKPRK